MSLYNTYRPKDWDSVIGQEYITTILRNSITTGRVHHAYLFHGSRGTGKTTSARILAKVINCLDPKEGNPCHECIHCKAFDNETMLDVIEIDGASNNGVENVRDLIEKARFEPNQGAYKIYIIDEVHMLSTGAFNALLKTIEQPPKHVKFILATTEIDKVPETIRSRALRFDFRKITLSDIIARLIFVCQAEGVTYEETALEIIAKAARGGLRDALTLLEQNILDSDISTEHVRYTLALLEESMIDACIEALRDGNTPRIQELIETLKEKHVEARGFFEQLMYRLRDLMIEHIDDILFYSYSELLGIFEGAYAKVRMIPDGMMLIEITLLRAVKRGGDIGVSLPKITATPIKTLSTPTPSKAPEPKELPITLPEKKSEKSIIEEKVQAIPKEEKTSTLENVSADTSQKSPPNFSYPALIAHLKDTQPALTTDLKTARFQIEEGKLTLIFSKKWNYDRVNTPKIKAYIAEAMDGLYHNHYTIVCTLGESSGGLGQVAHEVF